MKILPKEKPDLIISSGAAGAVPFFWLGKLFGAKTIYNAFYFLNDSMVYSYRYIALFLV